jgi:hypothetical protein
MMRLLVTGNSHAAALRSAWKGMTNRPEGLEVDFLNLPRKHVAHLSAASDGRFGLLDESLVPKEEFSLLRKINTVLVRDLHDYTHVLVAGCLLGIKPNLRLLAYHRIDLIREQPAGLPRLSQAAYAAFAQAITVKRIPTARIQSFSPWCKVGVCMAPRPSERALHGPASNGFMKALKQDTTGVRAALALTHGPLARAIAAQGGKFFPVPDSSLAASGFTKSSYSYASEIVEPDDKHMNAEYGALCLEPILEWVLGRTDQ